jgi:hypothetical protein
MRRIFCVSKQEKKKAQNKENKTREKKAILIERKRKEEKHNKKNMYTFIVLYESIYKSDQAFIKLTFFLETFSLDEDLFKIDLSI